MDFTKENISNSRFCSLLLSFSLKIVSLMGFLNGITNGWSSPALFLFTSNQSPLSSGRITVDEAAWVSSLTAVGMMISSMFVGRLASKYGRKWPLVLLTLPSIFSWALIYSAKNVYFLYVARIIQGFIAAGTFSFGQLYLIEISDYKYRTTIISINSTSKRKFS